MGTGAGVCEGEELVATLPIDGVGIAAGTGAVGAVLGVPGEGEVWAEAVAASAMTLGDTEEPAPRAGVSSPCVGASPTKEKRPLSARRGPSSSDPRCARGVFNTFDCGAASAATATGTRACGSGDSVASPKSDDAGVSAPPVETVAEASGVTASAACD